MSNIFSLLKIGNQLAAQQHFSSQLHSRLFHLSVHAEALCIFSPMPKTHSKVCKVAKYLLCAWSSLGQKDTEKQEMPLEDDFGCLICAFMA